MSALFPCVSVIMPVYNSEKFLCAAVESILAQTLRDFELIAIDDGSTDGSASILANFHQQDERIMILTHSENQGIVTALNRGLNIARGKYIARMDSDDISLPERVERQFEFLETHPQVGILGCDAIFVDSHDREIARLGHPREDLSIRWTSLLANVFFHPTVMIRRAVLTEFKLDYRTNFQSVEDYDLWVHILEQTQGANLDQPLVRYRVHSESISSQSKQEQMKKHVQVSFEYIQRMFPEIRFSPAEHALLVAAVTGNMDSHQYFQRPALVCCYLELWQAFLVRYRGKPAIKRLRHDAIVMAAKIGFSPPFQPGWLELMRALFAEDPFWVFFFAARFTQMVHLKRMGARLKRLRGARL